MTTSCPLLPNAPILPQTLQALLRLLLLLLHLLRPLLLLSPQAPRHQVLERVSRPTSTAVVCTQWMSMPMKAL